MEWSSPKHLALSHQTEIQNPRISHAPSPQGSQHPLPTGPAIFLSYLRDILSPHETRFKGQLATLVFD